MTKSERRVVMTVMRAYTAHLKRVGGSVDRLLDASETREGRALIRACAAHARSSKRRRK